ncbi:DNA-3-methyladenine glycosylase I [Halomonas cerina]|uniref:Uncharacterized protein n=1 Tax=Halomonas cerina TaxID=447424 RepID=A0A839VEC7_9GAMM|nr:DNA-3-methyladenine glycosylase I [Halomonas cerina]MBB3192478.1 hypothetical protein [Halomonas cerina]
MLGGHWNADAFPENWLDFRRDPPRLKPYYKDFRPREVHVLPDGSQSLDGTRGFFLPGDFRFCLACGQSHSSGRDWTRLGSLSAEGRSSATTTLTLSSLRYLLGAETELADEARKLLGFSDNRQDAALQAGHFNDFMQILLVRAGILAALEAKGGEVLTDRDLAQQIFTALGLDSSNPAIRADYLQNPDQRVPRLRRDAEEAMRNVLGYRAYHDLRRGWRYTVPNLEQLGLLQIDYDGLQEFCEDDHHDHGPRWPATLPLVRWHAGVDRLPRQRIGAFRSVTTGGCSRSFCLEGFQAGLNRRTILNKRENFRTAFCDFDIDTVARFTEKDVQRL